MEECPSFYSTSSAVENNSDVMAEVPKGESKQRKKSPQKEGGTARDGRQPPSSSLLVGSDLSGSVNYELGRRNNSAENTGTAPANRGIQNELNAPAVLHSMWTKRKYSSPQHEFSSSSPARLPHFIGYIPSADITNIQMLKPIATNGSDQLAPASSNSAEFITPTQPKKQSRPNSPSSAGSRLILPRSRVASIRRESDCSSEKKFGETEAAHEKFFKSTQQVSMGFEDFCLDDKQFEERKRAKSLTEPISIFTNAFLPQSSSPSPSRSGVETQKQCYSPSAQQVVRSNLAYSPSPSPTPTGSPSMHRMRSMSPIVAVRQISKRRYTGSGIESDGELPSNNSFSLSAPAPKRQCVTPKISATSSSSPLIRDSTTNLLLQHTLLFPSASSSIAEFFVASSPTNSTVSILNTQFGSVPSSGFLVDPNISSQCFSTSFDGQEEEDGQLMPSFCSSSIFNDANSSTTFSSRANTPESLQYGAENDPPSSSTLLPPSHSFSACSSADGSSSRSSSHLQNQDPSADINHSSTSKMTSIIGFGLLPTPFSSKNVTKCEEAKDKKDDKNTDDH